MSQGRRYIGKRVKRKEDPRFITGRGLYVDDIKLPGMVYAAFLRASYAHARIKSIDTSKAEKMPGVVGVYTGEYFKDKVAPLTTAWALANADLKPVFWPVVAHDKVRFTGDIVAVVVAEDPYTAYDALEAIDVEYEPLPVVVDVEEAIKPGAPQLHDEAPGNIAFKWRFSGGESFDKVAEKADVLIKQRMVNQRLIPSAMETRGAVASFNRGLEELTLWVTSQNPHVHRLVLSGVLGLPEHKIRVIAPDVGGGFGSKIPVYPGEVIVSRLAMDLGVPVKWVETRRENFVGTIHGRDHVEYVEAAATRDGRLLGVRVKTLANMGAYLSTAAPGVPTILFGLMLQGPYKIESVDVEVLGVLTNTTPVDAYRGAGRPEATYILERVMDLVARKLGLDPAEVRRRNLIEEAPYTTVTGLVYDSGRYKEVFEKALQIAEYEKWREEQRKARQEGRLIGIGISSYIEMCGLAPSRIARATGFGLGLYESVTIRVHPTGKVSVYTGSHPHGQGEETSFAQIVAEELGVPVEDVEIIHGDTDETPFGLGTYGSRTTPVGGGAVALAARRIREKARKIAAALLEAREEDVVFSEGKFHVRGHPEKSVSFQEVALEAYLADKLPEGLEPGLEATTFYDPENFVFPYGTHVCIVEVDRDTWKPRILRYVAVDDAGVIINPMLAEGQVHGGVVQGIAQALFEYAVYDESGNLLTSGFNDYMIPTAKDLPNIESYFVETPSPHNPLGAKGIGETGTIASTPAVVNAVLDALAHLGVEHIDMPLTPHNIWKALKDKGVVK
ncbi:carbon-monoxide dehydrogenase large subunit [Aeropyrum pernix]|uniref:Carbon-monoxide dehydrogenase large subunit n=1 Tax=Aeropyrum pernix TaxID=56636 RepID=A0A401HAP2_AERPX|nr:glyceraldehyde dehydrogenase subunit alpha [Aeropyrum pernix]GBF09477.1 carbon-monoxide dehydrogenase large subunit [Aeropyrum pernix]